MRHLFAFLCVLSCCGVADARNADVWRGTWTDASFGSGGVTLTITRRTGDTWVGTFRDNGGTTYPTTLTLSGTGEVRRLRGTAKGRRTYQITGTVTGRVIEAKYHPSRGGSMSLTAGK